MDGEYITLETAAQVAGYSNPSNLYTAARKGRLKTATFGPHARLTTRAWLDEYLASVRTGNYRRGQARRAVAGDATE